jgi:hypothetical protein
MPRRPSFLALLTAISCLVLVSGCGGGENLLSVSGTVTCDGTPLTEGSVRFVPDASKGNTAKLEPAGTIGSGGSYSVLTDGKSGAPAGWYKVSVASGVIPDSSKPNVSKAPFAAKYSNPETSGLSVEVKPGGSYDLKVTAK